MSDICINALLNYEIFIENKENVKSILGYWNVGCWQDYICKYLQEKFIKGTLLKNIIPLIYNVFIFNKPINCFIDSKL